MNTISVHGEEISRVEATEALVNYYVDQILKDKDTWFLEYMLCVGITPIKDLSDKQLEEMINIMGIEVSNE